MQDVGMQVVRLVCPCLVKDKDDDDIPDALKPSFFDEDHDYRHTPLALQPTNDDGYALQKMHTPQDLKPVRPPKGYMETPKALLPQKQHKYARTPKALKPERPKKQLATPMALKPFHDEVKRRRQLDKGHRPRKKEQQISMFESAYDSDDDFEDDSTITPLEREREPDF